jgi:arginine-tRNA-protein transferase
MSYRPVRRPNFYYTTAPLPCPYVPGRIERKVVTELTGVSAERRSHNIAYAPVCPACSACVPIRIRAADFVPNRTQRRITRMNADLSVQEMPPRATAEQFALFQRYQHVRHPDGDMATMSFYDYRAMVEDTPIETSLIEFRLPDGTLIGACLTDRLGDGLSAVYSYFTTASEARSLGTYAILFLIARAKAYDLPYVYLGYWVAESRKMAYKAKFHPSETLRGGQWIPLVEPEPALARETELT